MKDRVMRTILFFDLPNITSIDKKRYLMFKRFLLHEGFIMLQESVYSKLVLNSQQAELLLQRIKCSAPKNGLIQALTITEKQYAKIEYIIGDKNNKIIDNDDRLIIL